MSTDFINSVANDLAPLGFRRRETSVESGDFDSGVTIIERVKLFDHFSLVLIKTKGKTINPILNNTEFTKIFAQMVGYTLIRGLSMGVIIFSDEAIDETILNNIVNIKTERNAIVHWAINIPKQKEKTRGIHTFTTVPSTSILEYLLNKIGIKEPDKAVHFLEPNKQTKKLLKFAEKFSKISQTNNSNLSFMDYFTMFFVLLSYLKYDHMDIINDPIGIRIFTISYFIFFYLVGIYFLTIKPSIEDNQFNRRIIYKTLKVWVFPIIIGLFLTNIVFPYSKAHPNNTHIHIHLFPFPITITKSLKN